jgi:hypothetical protein
MKRILTPLKKVAASIAEKICQLGGWAFMQMRSIFV